MREQRIAARVAVLDPQGAVFMFRYSDAELGRHWVMPGGGLEPGETTLRAAARELAEETGWTDLTLGRVLWTWESDFTRLGVPVRQREQAYLSYGPRRDPIGDLTKAHEEDEILEWRWWSPSEIEATDELIWPPQLSTLLVALRVSGPPAQPIALGHVS